MKKTLLSLALLLVAMAAQAQSGGTIMQPTEITGRRIDASGVVYEVHQGQFGYTQNGKLNTFLLPDYFASRAYDYDGDFLTEVEIRQGDDFSSYYSFLRYSYVDGRLAREVVVQYDIIGKISTYTYYADGRLARKELASDDPDDYYGYSIYEYENEGRTRVESYSERRFVGTNLVFKLKYRTVNQYDDNYSLLSTRKDTYNIDGEVTSCKRMLYSYTPDGDVETEIGQTLVEGEWQNNTIHIYVYGDGRVVEQQDGTWSEDLGDWDIDKKCVHGLNDSGATYTVSFYQKEGGEWTWGVFNGQKLFFEPELKEQQKALGHFDEAGGSANINQFEFTMVATERPVYHSVGEGHTPSPKVYPNPGNGLVRIEAPAEDCVVRFYDLQGRLVTAKPFDFNTNVATDGWSQGVYLWEIWIGTQRQASGKWVKE